MSPTFGDEVAVLIASPLEPEQVERIRLADPRIRLLHDPALIPRPRYVADHKGIHPVLTAEQETRWRSMLAEADVSFDFDWFEPAELRANAPRLRWVQATSSGIGQFVAKTDLPTDQLVLTTAAGVHSVPLAEFALMGVLHFVKDVPLLTRVAAARRWARYTTSQLAGRRVLVVGLGHVGRRVVETFHALGTEVVGVGRTDRDYGTPAGVRTVDMAALDDELASADAVVLCCPLTPETHGLIGAAQLRRMKPTAILVNIARGGVVDEGALLDALTSDRIAGAALDVFETEPLPEESPFWDLANVIVSPHSASTVDVENRLIVDIFVDNLRRWLAGEPLQNVYDPARGY